MMLSRWQNICGHIIIIENKVFVQTCLYKPSVVEATVFFSDTDTNQWGYLYYLLFLVSHLKWGENVSICKYIYAFSWSSTFIGMVIGNNMVTWNIKYNIALNLAI